MARMFAGPSGAWRSNDWRYRIHPWRNWGQSGTRGIGSVPSGSSPHRSGWCQHRPWPVASRCRRIPARSLCTSLMSSSQVMAAKSSSTVVVLPTSPRRAGPAPRSLSGVDAVTWRHHLDNGDITRWLPEAIKDPKLAEQVAALVREHLSTDEAPGRVRALIQEQYPRRRSPSRYRDVGQSWPGRVSTASRAPPSRARERRAADRQIAPRMCQAQAARRAACA